MKKTESKATKDAQDTPEPELTPVSSTGNEGRWSLKIAGLSLTLRALGDELKEAVQVQDEQKVLELTERRAWLVKEIARLEELRLARCPFECQECRALEEK